MTAPFDPDAASSIVERQGSAFLDSATERA